MRVRSLHPFDLEPREAIALQRELASRVQTTGRMPRPLRLVLGVDCAPDRDGLLYAAAVLCRAPEWEVVETAIARGRPPMPYVPGLLSFRELPLVLEALAGIATEPDLVLTDGQGVAHPRGLGIGAHLGLHLPMPVVGIGKSRLCGTHDEPGPDRGAAVSLRYGTPARTIGRVVRTRNRVKPLYVSVGNRIALRGAVAVALLTATRYRLPEPVRHADQLSKASARSS